MRTVTVALTEEHISFREDPFTAALLDALPGVKSARVEWRPLGEGGDVHLMLRRRPFLRSRMVSARLDEAATVLSQAADNCPETLTPATFTVRVPRSAVTP